ncbi:ABC transporter ATP-binding protein [Agromyces sp. SYSU T00194]|uniref:ABC transporter ATP-binding protein n=1 Tax=Agromyces chitinivorans TaxID=3158560 RepID=UPI00339A2212
MTEPLLRVRNVRKEFRVRGTVGRRTIRPVDDVSFDIPHGRTVALVGESGSGKSTLARLIMGLHRPDAGAIELAGAPLSGLSARRSRARRHELQMVFQNPLLSFDPMRTIGWSIGEVLRLDPERPADRDRRVAELLTSVGLSSAFAGLRPRGVSGGELQRAAIARAIASAPKLLVLDEPTSALDVSIQGQVLALLERMQEERGMTYLMATHDLKVVRLTSHEVIVLFRGRIVERATTSALFAAPRHPYTRRLFRAELAGEAAEETTVGAECPVVGGDCPEPHHEVVLSADHVVRCWRHDEMKAAA